MADARSLSTKHKVYGGALAVAVIAFIYDQSHSGGPARSRAAALPIAVQTIAPPTAPAEASVAATASLARRLRSLSTAADPFADLRDAFAPSGDWGADQRATAGATIETFAAAHKLTVVLLPSDRSTGAAVIGGRLVQVGQTVDGYRLTTVGPRWARLSGLGGLVELRMP